MGLCQAFCLVLPAFSGISWEALTLELPWRFSIGAGIGISVAFFSACWVLRSRHQDVLAGGSSLAIMRSVLSAGGPWILVLPLAFPAIGSPLSLLVWGIIIAAVAVLIGMSLFLDRERLRSTRVLEQAFAGRIRELAGRLARYESNVYVFGTRPSEVGSALAREDDVVFSREMLDKLSCREIDAIAARQLAYAPVRFVLVGAGLCGLVYPGLGFLPVDGNTLVGLWGVCALFQAVLVPGLARHLSIQADLEAVKATEDPEGLLSAIWRIHGATAKAWRTSAIVRYSGLTSNQLASLTAAFQSSGENRYSLG